MDHFHHAVLGVAKTLHCISSFKVAHNSLHTASHLYVTTTMLYQVLVKYCTIFRNLRWLTTVYNTYALMDHYHHAISIDGKIMVDSLLLSL